MLERLQNSVDPRPTGVAFMAMDTAIRQQSDFQKAAEEIRARQEQERVERQRKVQEEARLSRSHDSGHTVDVVVGDSSSSNGAQTDANPDQRGAAVDVEV